MVRVTMPPMATAAAAKARAHMGAVATSAAQAFLALALLEKTSLSKRRVAALGIAVSAANCVSQDGWSLHWASSALKDDRDLAMACARSDGLAIQLASERLRQDREVMQEAIGLMGDLRGVVGSEEVQL